MTRVTPVTIGFALILSLAGTAHAASAGPSVSQRTLAWIATRAVKPWLPRFDPKTDWNFNHASPTARRACLRAAALPIPRADVPTAAQIPHFASCNSEALYYGFAGKPNYVRARKCAFLERALDAHRPMSGSAVLSMIFANGLGVKRNLPLATKFACEAGGAPAEIDGRVAHLKLLATMTKRPLPRFGFCDDITSGLMDGVCTGVAATYRDVRREKTIAHIASSYTPAQQAALSALESAAAAYFDKHALNEVDLSGTARPAYWIEDLEHSWNGFLRDLRALEAEKLPVANSRAAHRADVRLAAVYHRVLAEPTLRQRPIRHMPPPSLPVAGGTISREGIRTDEALWLSYRDAWVHFAAARKPALAHATVRTWITRQRTRNLRCLLPYGTPGARGCSRPTLMPSNMRR